MKEERITIRLDEKEYSLLSRLSQQEQRSESEIVRTALRKYCEEALSQANSYELAKALGIIGITKELPCDLSTNESYFEGFSE
ncbi:CopG family transcriptional regulator [Euhalothece natronophila Z-M001]|uniref:CopG family transcriptional regulator n=1 Tax=Euhalothece natronophila Z-M001 TaxID=522448 RepID=A0A5B8NIU5_9CHRO|nr:ribbon-helix-helix protein, CopG family [Euhalothece natronophila]QDZ39152.1 CopG family transcriptional regulator [Euhalothece natronophila Z-M001]